MSRELLRHGALLSAALIAGLALVPTAVAQNCDQCDKHCPPYVKYHYEGPPKLKFKRGCPRPLCDPCNLPHYGYFQTCWHPWPFPPDWSHCAVPPPATMVPYEHPGRTRTLSEPPRDGDTAPAPRKTDRTPERGSTEGSSVNTVTPAATVQPPAGEGAALKVPQYLPPPSLPALNGGTEKVPVAAPLPLGEQTGRLPGSEEPQAQPKPETTPEPPTATPAVPLSRKPDGDVAPGGPAPTGATAAVTQASLSSSVEPQRPRAVGAGSSASNVRMVNSHRIMLDYDLADVPHPDQAELELWFTQDGKKWQKDQTSLRSGSPYLVEVNREGTYGFTLIARRPGEQSSGPAAGEAPQVWVEVDWTKPLVHMVHATAGQGRQVNVVWIASDNNLARQPITLSYAETADGPWKPVVANIENSGRYDWQVPANVPNRVFIRAEAADLVGNVGSGRTPNPVTIPLR